MARADSAAPYAVTESLKDAPEAVEALAQRLSKSSGIPEPHLEKDFWVTEALRVMSLHAESRPYELVFKGGTSLSKAHHLIHRFSEDIDVLLVFGDQGVAARETELKAVLSAVENQLGVDLDHDSPRATGKKRGSHRSAEFTWTTSLRSVSGVEPRVLIELGVDGGSIPNVVLELSPMIATLAVEDGLAFPYREAEPFRVVVMEPTRTLVEKLMLVHTAATDPHMKERTKRAAARHYYDIFCLLDSDLVRKNLEGQVAHLAKSVHVHSTNAGRPSWERPAKGFSESSAFTKVGTKYARDEYDNIVINSLVWPSAPSHPSFDECLDIVQTHSGLL